MRDIKNNNDGNGKRKGQAVKSSKPFDRKPFDKQRFNKSEKEPFKKPSLKVKNKKYDNYETDKESTPKLHVKNPHLLLYGTHAVNAALENPDRVLKMLYVTPNRQEDYEAYSKQVKLRTVSKEEMDSLLPATSVHQGIALLSDLKEVAATQDFTASKTPIVMLDGLSDPQNIGAILRSCAAFGVHHLVMQDKGSPEITGALAKAAAGAVEAVRIHKVVNLSRALESLQAKKFMVYGADGHSETSLDTINFPVKSVIVMGAEGSGMRRLVRENCDCLFKIPMADHVESLNVSNALAITLYAVSVSARKIQG